jgi:hypothetical protein
MELMRPQRVIIDLREMLGTIEHTLERHVGTVIASVTEKKFIITVLLDEYIYGVGIDGKCVKDIDDYFMNFSIPTEVRARLLHEIRIELFEKIHRSFLYIYPSRHYSYTVIKDTIVIDESVIDFKRPCPVIECHDDNAEA